MINPIRFNQHFLTALFIALALINIIYGQLLVTVVSTAVFALAILAGSAKRNQASIGLGIMSVIAVVLSAWLLGYWMAPDFFFIPLIISGIACVIYKKYLQLAWKKMHRVGWGEHVVVVGPFGKQHIHGPDLLKLRPGERIILRTTSRDQKLTVVVTEINTCSKPSNVRFLAKENGFKNTYTQPWSSAHNINQIEVKVRYHIKETTGFELLNVPNSTQLLESVARKFHVSRADVQKKPEAWIEYLHNPLSELVCDAVRQIVRDQKWSPTEVNERIHELEALVAAKISQELESWGVEPLEVWIPVVEQNTVEVERRYSDRQIEIESQVHELDHRLQVQTSHLLKALEQFKQRENTDEAIAMTNGERDIASESMMNYVLLSTLLGFSPAAVQPAIHTAAGNQNNHRDAA